MAAGHPLSAEAGAGILRQGGNAVDAAVAALLTAAVCESLLTGPGAGGYMLVAEPGSDPVLLDFFVEAPGRNRPTGPGVEPPVMVPVEISFGDAVQVFNIGPASVGTPGMPAGVAAAIERFGTAPLSELARDAVALAREGVAVSPQQAYLTEILGPLVTQYPECAALFAPGGRLLQEGERLRQPELADTLERLGTEGAAPFYSGDLGAAVVEWLASRGGVLGAADLKAYDVVARPPLVVRYRDCEVITNPPPSAGGILIASALQRLDALGRAPSATDLLDAMEFAQVARTNAFVDGLAEPDFAEQFLAGGPRGGRLGSTTHIAVLDGEGRACSMTTSSGAGSGVIVPGTGIHLNNMLGEQDLNPQGFHRYPPGRRLPSMMAPTVVRRDGEPRLMLGSAGSNRIRSAILQTIVRSVDQGMHAGEAVSAPRLHLEDRTVYAEPGIVLDSEEIRDRDVTVAHFRSPNLFFGGVQAVELDAAGRFHGGGDPRRGGAAVVIA